MWSGGMAAPHAFYDVCAAGQPGIQKTTVATFNNIFAPATTAVFPWISAYGGIVDVVYYATNAARKDDATAVWNVYLAETSNDGASLQQSLVSKTSNLVGVACTSGTARAPGTRNLLVFFRWRLIR